MHVKASILVTGASGQLAQSVNSISQEYPEYSFTFVNREQLDFTEPASLVSYFKTEHFDFIINCAAYTAVDKAEQEQDIANLVNAEAVKVLAEEAKKSGATLIHVSTDYVFDGTACQPYREETPTNPINSYGETKCRGEQAICEVLPTGLIIRTSWLYSEFGHNFVKTMLRLGRERNDLNIVADQVGTPTYAYDLARAIMSIIQQNDTVLPSDEAVPIYHFSNEGVCSWFDLTKAIFELKNITCKVSPIRTEFYPTPAARPSYSLLDKTKIKQHYQLTIPYWKESLALCLSRLKEEE